MSKRLQVLLPDADMEDIQRLAAQQGTTVGEWVRRVLSAARSQRATGSPEAKLRAVREAVRHSYPTADIKQMLAEIEQGYLE